MYTAISRGTLMGVVLLSIACGRSMPTAPTANSQSPAVPSTPAPSPSNFPPLSGGSRTFAFNHELTYHLMDYTKQSRFVLYDNGAFGCSIRRLAASIAVRIRSRTGSSLSSGKVGASPAPGVRLER